VFSLILQPLPSFPPSLSTSTQSCAKPILPEQDHLQIATFLSTAEYLSIDTPKALDCVRKQLCEATLVVLGLVSNFPASRRTFLRTPSKITIIHTSITLIATRNTVYSSSYKWRIRKVDSSSLTRGITMLIHRVSQKTIAELSRLQADLTATPSPCYQSWSQKRSKIACITAHWAILCSREWHQFCQKLALTPASKESKKAVLTFLEYHLTTNRTDPRPITTQLPPWRASGRTKSS
jgi:hypothetical protein